MSRTSLRVALIVGALAGATVSPGIVAAQGVADAGASSEETQRQSRALLSPPEVVGFGVVLTAAFFADGALRGEYGNPEYRPLFYQTADALGNAAIVLPILGSGYLIGRIKRDPDLSHAFANAVISGLLAGAATQAMKLVIGRVRPNETADSGLFRPFEGHAAFPSGHASYASAVLASLVMDSSSRALRVAAYGGIAACALARLHYNRHWTSDVLAGAALGVVSARLVARLRHRDTQIEVTPGGLMVRVLF